MLVGLVFELNQANRIAVYTAESTRCTQFIGMNTSRIENPEISALLRHISSQFPAEQAEAFATQVKVPLLYANMLVRNNRYNGPYVTARQPYGRISIAGSDAEAYGYVNAAIDAARRAVHERLGVRRI